MKVLVIGAAGRTGRAVVEKAVAAGHVVTAFVRKAEEYKGPGVRVIAGDATNGADINAAMLGQDAVLDTVGGKTPYWATTLEASVAGAVITSMEKNNVRRLVVTSTMGEGDSKANTPFYDRLLMTTFLHGTGKDKAEMESALKSSALDWVILRPAILNDDPALGNVRIFEPSSGEKAHEITRTDLATFMVAQLSTDEHLHRAVTVANS